MLRTKVMYSPEGLEPRVIEVQHPIAILAIIGMLPALVMHLMTGSYFDLVLSLVLIAFWPQLWREKISIFVDRVEVQRGFWPIVVTMRYGLDEITELLPLKTAPESKRGFLGMGVLSFKYQKRIHRILGGGTKADARKCAEWIETAQKRHR